MLRLFSLKTFLAEICLTEESRKIFVKIKNKNFIPRSYERYQRPKFGFEGLMEADNNVRNMRGLSETCAVIIRKINSA